MSNLQYYCPICHSHSGCFEQCFEKMYAYCLKHFPQSTPSKENQTTYQNHELKCALPRKDSSEIPKKAHIS